MNDDKRKFYTRFNSKGMEVDGLGFIRNKGLELINWVPEKILYLYIIHRCKMKTPGTQASYMSDIYLTSGDMNL